MSFLKRLLGGDGSGGPDASTPGPADDVVDEPEREREVIREEQARHDELIDRQLRYAHLSWQPPAQGGDRRADSGGEEP